MCGSDELKEVLVLNDAPLTDNYETDKKSSIRKKLTVNENDSKNTRMNIASAGVLATCRWALASNVCKPSAFSAISVMSA